MWDAILGGAGLVANLFNASENRESQEKIAAQNIANQKEFAQNGVRWKVADAQAAGLHPLAALGAQTSSFSNVVGATGDTNDYSDMGQKIGRAIDAGSTHEERSDRMGAAIDRTAKVFQLEKMNLENEVLKSDIALKRASLPPPFPTGGPPIPGNWKTMVSGVNRTSTGDAIKDKDIEQQSSDAPAYKTYKFMGIPMTAHPAMSDGQVLEDRLGDSEVLSTLTAIGNLIGDAYHTYGPKYYAGKGKSPPRSFPYYR